MSSSASDKDKAALAATSHPLTFAALDRCTAHAEVDYVFCRDSPEQSRSFEMTADAEAAAPKTTEKTVRVPPPSPPRAGAQRRGSGAVHVDPRRSATVTAAAAAAARQAAEEREKAQVRPMTAEEESWGHWGFRHAYNSVVMMMITLYQVVQLGVKHQPVDMKTLENTASAYMPTPPRAAELKKAETAATGNA
ncbi:hypothetical protein NESM_000044100 [Novymonas esmeraldas]|uniref:Uncharacterized protein n=1 Tax=Novymonas esmeraldas TaxID=1808958 RepID=A0AAW0F2U7_9TRYP